MVNIRATLEVAYTDSVITSSEQDGLLAIAKNLHYKDRSYAKIFEIAKGVLGEPRIGRISLWLSVGRVDQKKRDAESLLKYIATMKQKNIEKKQVTYKFENTYTWGSSDKSLDLAKSGKTELQFFSCFHGIDIKFRDALGRKAIAQSFRAGEILFQQGDVAESFYLIRNGEIEICLFSGEGQKIDLSVLGGGESFGEIGLLDGGPRTAAAIARTDCELSVVTKDGFEEVLRSFSPNEWLSFTRNICQTLRGSSANLESLRFSSGEQRLALKLLNLSKENRAIKISQNKLGDMASLSRETTNRILKKFERDGSIELGYGIITVLNNERLRENLGIF